MSNYHTLQTSEGMTKIVVVFHIAVPNENNFVDINLQTAMSQLRPNPGSAVPWQQSGTEYDAIQNGEIREYVETMTFALGLTLPQKQAIIDNRYTALAEKTPDKIREELKFWG